MKTIKLSIFSYFSEYSEGGIAYNAIQQDMSEYYKNDSKYKYLCDVEVPETPRNEVTEMATAQLRKEIVDLRIQADQKEEKIKELLAIEYKGES